jgi:purine-binding chemotaxis protein CheW
MLGSVKAKAGGKATVLLTFYLGEALCGLDISQVEELNRFLGITPVPKAPPYVLGLVNLRGRIVTVLDLGKKVGLTPTVLTPASRTIIVQNAGEHLGLLVDRVSEVAAVDQEQVAATPANLKGPASQFFAGVLKTDQGLIGILNLTRVLQGDDGQKDAPAG